MALIYQPKIVVAIDGHVDTDALERIIALNEGETFVLRNGVPAAEFLPPFESGTPANGDRWEYNTAAGEWKHEQPSGGGDLTLDYKNTADSNNVTGTSETDFNKHYTVPADDLAVGTVLRVKAHFDMKCTLIGPNTITVRFYFGGTAQLSWSFTPNSSTYKGFGWTFLCICRTAGASGSVSFSRGSELTRGPQAVAATIDTTGTNLIKLSGQWNGSSASNVATLKNLIVEQLNTS